MLAFDVLAVLIYDHYKGGVSPIGVALIVLIGYIMFHLLNISIRKYKGG
jgi:hypothetical protein